MKIKRWLAIIPVVLLFLGVAAYLAAPTYIKHRVEKELAGCTVGSVTLHDGYIELHDVVLKRPGLQATFPRILVDTEETAYVLGGHVFVDPDDIKQSEGPPRLPKHIIHLYAVDAYTWYHNTTLSLLGISGIWGGELSVAVVTGRHRDYGAFEVVHLVRTPGPDTSFTYRADVVRIHDFPDLPTNPCDEVTLSDVEVFTDNQRVLVDTAICGNNRANNVQIARAGDDVTVRMESMVVQHPWLHSMPLVITHPVTVDVEKGIVGVSVGEVGIVFNLARKHLDVAGSCADIAREMPAGLAEPLEGLTFSGDLDIHIMWGDQPDVTVKGQCRAACAAPRLRALRSAFHYQVYTPDWGRRDRVSGPGSQQWMPLPGVAPAMGTATIALEDPGFLHHRGWIAGAFRNSLRIDLERGKFIRGGSTITMQLAKNLWLNRDKTFGRKADELLLASALEGCFTKEEILELYLNVVQFGPDLYGIGPAAQHWFHVSPSELSSRQAFWLASILPHPYAALPPDERTLEQTEKFMQRLVDAGQVPESVLSTVPEGATDGW